MSATPAPTASKVSNGRTNAPDGYTSILMRPLVAAPMVCAKRTALAWLPGVSSDQSVTSFNCRIPCAIAGAGKLKVAPVANDPAPARISRRLTSCPALCRASTSFVVRFASTDVDGIGPRACPRSAPLTAASRVYSTCGDKPGHDDGG